MTILLLLILAAMPLAAQAIPPVAAPGDRWEMTEGTGSVLGNTITPANSCSCTTCASWGTLGGSDILDFSAVDAVYDCGSMIDNYQAEDPWTLVMFFQPDAQLNQGVAGNYTYASATLSNRGLGISGEGGTAGLMRVSFGRDSSNRLLKNLSASQSNNWIVVTAVKTTGTTASTMTIYVNGAVDAAVTIVDTLSPGTAVGIVNWVIGARNSNAPPLANFFTSNMAGHAVYDTALPANGTDSVEQDYCYWRQLKPGPGLPDIGGGGCAQYIQEVSTPAIFFHTSESQPQALLIDSCTTYTAGLWDTFSDGEQQFGQTAAETALGDGCLPYRPAFLGRP